MLSKQALYQHSCHEAQSITRH